MKLKKNAHSRSGDKGNISNLSLIPYDDKDYELLKERVTASAVKQYFGDIVKGEVFRYELLNIKAFNFVMKEALNGGVTASLCVDKHGKSLSSALMEMDIDGQSQKPN